MNNNNKILYFKRNLNFNKKVNVLSNKSVNIDSNKNVNPVVEKRTMKKKNILLKETRDLSNILYCSYSIEELKMLLLKNYTNVSDNINLTNDHTDSEEETTDSEKEVNKLDIINENINISVEQEKKNNIILQNRIILKNAIFNINEKFDSDIKNKLEELEKIKQDCINDIEKKRAESIKYSENKLANCEIPLIIFQTWITKNLPDKMIKTINKLKTINPEFEHRLFDDEDIKNFLSEHFNPDVLNAFNKLIPGAFKADLWRYCVLYIYGGIYLDIKYEPVNNFKLLEIIDKEYVTLDRNHFGGPVGIYNGFIIAKPNNDLFLKLINKVVENVKSRFYGMNALQVTGPSLMGKIMFPNKMYSEMCNSFILKYSNDGLGLLFKEKRILQQYPEYRKDQSKLIKSNYQSLWERRLIYN